MSGRDERSRDEERPADVAVVGGGLAGLAAANYLARDGLDVLVLERAGELGGRARTRERSGFRLNAGPHALYRGGAAAAVLAELGVAAPGGSPPLGGEVWEGERWHPLPFGPTRLATSRLLGARDKLAVARLLAGIGRVDPAPWDAIPVSEWLERSLPGARARRLVEMLVRLTTYSNAPARASAGAVLRQLALARAGVRYVDGGWSRIVDGLARSARAAGARVLPGTPVERVETTAGTEGPTRFALTDGSGLVHHARRVLVAGAPGLAARLLGGLAPSLRALAARVTPVRAACLDVGLDALPRPDRSFVLGATAPLYLSVHSAHARLAPEGAALVQLARYGAPAEEPRPTRDRRELEALLEAAQPGALARARTVRFLPALVVQHALVEADQGGLPGRPDVALADRPGLYLAGDWIGAEGLLADASLASARSAARRIASDLASARGRTGRHAA